MKYFTLLVLLSVISLAICQSSPPDGDAKKLGNENEGKQESVPGVELPDGGVGERHIFGTGWGQCPAVWPPRVSCPQSPWPPWKPSKKCGEIPCRYEIKYGYGHVSGYKYTLWWSIKIKQTRACAKWGQILCSKYNCHCHTEWTYRLVRRVIDWHTVPYEIYVRVYYPVGCECVYKNSIRYYDYSKKIF